MAGRRDFSRGCFTRLRDFDSVAHAMRDVDDVVEEWATTEETVDDEIGLAVVWEWKVVLRVVVRRCAADDLARLVEAHGLTPQGADNIWSLVHPDKVLSLTMPDSLTMPVYMGYQRHGTTGELTNVVLLQHDGKEKQRIAFKMHMRAGAKTSCAPVGVVRVAWCAWQACCSRARSRTLACRAT